jgi:HSP20 family protein
LFKHRNHHPGGIDMALVRWEPVRELSSLQNDMNRLFNTFFDTPTGGNGGNGGAAPRRWIPAMDLVETEDHFVLKADLPGLSEDDVHIDVEDNILTVSGERKAEHEDKREGYVRVERSYGSFRRSLTLPEGVEPEAVSASFAFPSPRSASRAAWPSRSAPAPPRSRGTRRRRPYPTDDPACGPALSAGPWSF